MIDLEPTQEEVEAKRVEIHCGLNVALRIVKKQKLLYAAERATTVEELGQIIAVIIEKML